MKKEVLRIENLSTSFLGERALHNLRINLYEGEALGIIGLNGSGKTIIVKVLSGTCEKDSGTIYIDNKKVNIQSKKDASKLGIYSILKNNKLISNLTVAENINVTKKITMKNFIVDEKSLNNRVKKLFSEFELEISPDITASRLTEGQQRLVELLKAYESKARLIILDDIIGLCSNKEKRKLVQMVRMLKSKGTSFIITDHKYQDELDIFDRISVIREGRAVKTLVKEEFNKELIINLSVGYEFNSVFRRSSKRTDKSALEFFRVSAGYLLKDVSFSVKKGEILGICDIEGQWALELIRLLMGSEETYSGVITIEGKIANLGSLKDAVKSGVGIVSERFLGKQLFNNMSAIENLYFPILKRISGPFGYVSERIKRFISKECISKFGLLKEDRYINTRFLSKGNQYKVIVNKWILSRSKIMVMDNPTIGADIVTKQMIYSILNKASEEGIGILFVSSDMSEVISISDRVIMVKNGGMEGYFDMNGNAAKPIYETTI